MTCLAKKFPRERRVRVGLSIVSVLFGVIVALFDDSVVSLVGLFDFACLLAV